MKLGDKGLVYSKMKHFQPCMIIFFYETQNQMLGRMSNITLFLTMKLTDNILLVDDISWPFF